MLLKCIVWLIVLRFVENRCHYLLSQSNDKYDICLNDQCHQIIDPILIEVKPLDCKTNELYLKFSNYKTYQTFLNRIQKKKISDFFPSKSSNEQRILRIYLLQVDHDDKILDYQELIEIGHHLDIYQLFISNLTATNHYFPSIQYDQFNSQWNIIQINFECKSLKRLNENPCEPKIVHPPLFPFHHESPLQRISTLISSSPSTSSLPIAQQQQQKQQQYILFICLPIIIFLISVLILIIFICKKRQKKELESEIDDCSSRNSLSCNRPAIIAEAYHVSRIPSPHKDSLYEHGQFRF